MPVPETLYIYELDPTGGYCGFPAEISGLPPANVIRQELIRRNKIIKMIESELKITVKRIFLRNPGSVDNTLIKDFLKKEGNKAYPIFLSGTTIIHSGNFPDFEILSQKLTKTE